MLLSLELQGLSVVVFGQTDEVLRRARDLLHSGAQVTVVAPVLSPAIDTLTREEPAVTVRLKEPTPEDLEGQWLAVVADRNPSWVRLLAPIARQKRIFFCAIDQPQQNTFAHVGVARLGDLSVGVSTGGRAPGLVASLTRELLDLFVRSQFQDVVNHVVRLRAESAPNERSTLVREFVKDIRIVGTIVSPLTESKEPTRPTAHTKAE